MPRWPWHILEGGGSVPAYSNMHAVPNSWPDNYVLATTQITTDLPAYSDTGQSDTPVTVTVLTCPK